MSSAVAELPQYVVLKSNSSDKYLHFLWNDEFTNLYKCMGTYRVVDRVSPFVKLEVVTSTADPSLVHLRCSYNDKYLELVPRSKLMVFSATADQPQEDRAKDTCTLFRPLLDPAKPNTVGLLYLGSKHGGPLHIFSNSAPSYVSVNGVACVYNSSLDSATYFEFSPWMSYEEEIGKLKEEEAADSEEIGKLKDKVAADAEEMGKLKDKVAADAEEIGKLNDKVAADAVEIGKLKEEVAAEAEEIGKLKEEVAGWEEYEEERKAALAAEELKVESQVASVWEAFKANTKAAAKTSTTTRA